MSARLPKTLAMRLLDDLGIAYEVVAFPESIHDALGVAEHAGLPPQQVFKTLVVLPPVRRARPLLILIPAGTTLDLRRAAEALGFKRLSMARPPEAERLTGLKVGGISALALQAKKFPVYLDRSAEPLETIVVSAGRRGLNLRLGVEGFRRATGAEWIDCARPDESRLRLA
ncbi:MAG TPA: YbaK/EbsC family protein [Anaerolineales bacterium]|nr:YbaK/EbsC family protein [Anaerolineales bacterium]